MKRGLTLLYVIFSSQFFLQFHFKMEKAPQASGPPPPAGVKRPPPLMSGVGTRPPNESMPPPPPGGMSIPPLPPGAPGAPHMPPQMPMPPMPMRPPPPDGLTISNNWSPTSISWLLSFMVCSHTALPVYSVHLHLDTAGTFSLLISTNDVIVW